MSFVTVQVLGADGFTQEVIGDSISNRYHPLYKMSFGTEGNSVLVSTTNPLPVQGQLVDETGTAYGVKHIENKPRVSSMPYTYDIAEGNEPNHFPLRKFGHNSDVGAAIEDVWDGAAAYVYQTSAEILKVSSGDVDDQGDTLSSGTATGGSTTTLIDTAATFSSDGVAAGDVVLDDTNIECGFVLTVDFETQITLSIAKGTAFKSGDSYRVVNANDTGAAVVEVQGLDTNYDRQKEYVVLATAASVDTSNSYIRVFRAKVVHAGSSGFNEGIISIKNNAETNTLAAISLGQNQTLMALWTVPDGFTAYLTNLYASTSSSKATEVYLYVRPFGSVFQVKKLITIFEGASQLFYDFPLNIAQRSDIAIRAATAGGGGEVSAGFDLWYE
jgi:hypothetical protein